MTDHLHHAEIAVERLLTQYREYLDAMRAIEQQRSKKLAHVAEISRQHGMSIQDVLAQDDAYETLRDDARIIRLLERDRDQIADAMTFANPLIWIMYKDRAYRGTSQAIRDWAAFKLHCAPEGYICGKRFRFLERHLQDTRSIAFATAFADHMPLAEVCTQPLIIGLLDDRGCMETWEQQEYHRTDGAVTKWGVR
ncbi:MAG: hypothetical protein Q8R16_03200 [bacterium]|nr:hypothetical protein [bacterium]